VSFFFSTIDLVLVTGAPFSGLKTSFTLALPLALSFFFALPLALIVSFRVFGSVASAMRAEGLEPPRSFDHQDLNLARLPNSATPAWPGPLGP
jgi:hypothetical protein